MSKGFPGGSDGKESSCNAGDQGSIPGSERSTGEGNGYPFQFSCLENPIDRGAWQATVHRVSRIGYDLATKERERESHDDKYTSKLEQLTETKSLSPV